MLYWSVLVVYIISFIISMIIFAKELQKRKRDIIMDCANNPFPKWLKLWSTTSFIMYLSFFVITMSRWFIANDESLFNIVGAAISLIFYLNGGIFVTMYQITRLQYCFSSQSTHFVQYGYSKSTFIILYFIGIIQIIGFVVWVILLTSSIYFVNDQVQFDLSPTGCVIVAAQLYVQFAAYHIWNTVVLVLFLYKMCHIRGLTQLKENSVYKQINFIVTKITTLEGLFQFKELAVAIYSQISIGPTLDKDQNNSMILFIIWGIDVLLSVVFMYLMIEHNNKEYIIIIRPCCHHKQSSMDEDNTGGSFKLEKTEKDTTTTTGDLDIGGTDNVYISYSEDCYVMMI